MRLPRPNNYLIANFVLWALTYVIVTARVAADPMPYAGQMALRRLAMAVFGFVAWGEFSQAPVKYQDQDLASVSVGGH